MKQHITFSVEEINLMCIFDTADRQTLSQEISQSLPHVYEPEMIAIMQSAMDKLKHITDEEFFDIGLFAADEFEEQEE